MWTEPGFYLGYLPQQNYNLQNIWKIFILGLKLLGKYREYSNNTEHPNSKLFCNL